MSAGKFTKRRDGLARVTMRPEVHIGAPDIVVGLLHRSSYAIEHTETRRKAALTLACEVAIAKGLHAVVEWGDFEPEEIAEARAIAARLFPELADEIERVGP